MTIQIFQMLIESGWLHATVQSFLPLAFLLVVWMAVLSLATNNLRVLRQKTTQMTLSALVRHPHKTDTEIWRMILPQWKEMVSAAAFVLPSRHRLWIQPASPDLAARLIGFGPEWVEAIRTGRMVWCATPSQPANGAENPG